MLNICIFEGRLTKDPDLRKTQTGLSITNIVIAVDDAIKKNGEKQTLFLPCTFFGAQAENVAKFFRKGKAIQVYGSLKCDMIENKENPLEKKAMWFLNAQKFEFPISEQKKQQEGSPAPLPQTPNGLETSGFETNVKDSALDVVDDDLPF